MEPPAAAHIDFDPDRVQRALESPTRLRAVERLQLLDSGSDERFDRITQLAARLLGVPICVMSLLDGERQYFKARHGTQHEPPALDFSLCKYVVAAQAPLVVGDLGEHPVLHDHAAVTGHGMRAYVGAPLQLSTGEVVGTLCAFDTAARAWTDDDLQTLETLASTLVTEAELLTCARDLEASEQRLSQRTQTMERLLDELRELRSTEQGHVAAVMQDHSLEAVMEALQQVRATQASSSHLLARRLEPVADCLAEATSSLRGLVGMLMRDELADSDLSAHIVAEAAAVTRRYGLELEATVELGDAHLHAPARTLLARAVVELVHNACIYSGGGKVWVRASVIAGHAMVRVADEGGGWSGAAGAGTSLSRLAEELYALDGRLESGRGGDEFAVTLSLPVPRRRGGGHGVECA